MGPNLCHSFCRTLSTFAIQFVRSELKSERNFTAKAQICIQANLNSPLCLHIGGRNIQQQIARAIFVGQVRSKEAKSHWPHSFASCLPLAHLAEGYSFSQPNRATRATKNSTQLETQRGRGRGKEICAQNDTQSLAESEDLVLDCSQATRLFEDLGLD